MKRSGVDDVNMSDLHCTHFWSVASHNLNARNRLTYSKTIKHRLSQTETRFSKMLSSNNLLLTRTTFCFRWVFEKEEVYWSQHFNKLFSTCLRMFCKSWELFAFANKARKKGISQRYLSGSSIIHHFWSNCCTWHKVRLYYKALKVIR